ncbi:hypothetical protein AXX17_AT1G54300 [Arabidopsis thaliana]|uniref:Retrotransposon gag domain-containing protein n=1 Tax=Arabidopsis thaliana TaxID=3702 RepID=A0A178WAQ4_ARATH|nr:hypothetical protein AXX17_AT1G54300 [Arabidopsis thaliana]
MIKRQTRSIKTSGEPKNFELTGVVGEEDQPPREASERGAFDESKLVDVNIALSWEAFEVKQGTETVREYYNEFLKKVKNLGRAVGVSVPGRATRGVAGRGMCSELRMDP